MKRKSPKFYYEFTVFEKDRRVSEWEIMRSFPGTKYRWYTEVLEQVQLFPKQIRMLTGGDFEHEAIVFTYKRKQYMVAHYKYNLLASR